MKKEYIENNLGKFYLLGKKDGQKFYLAVPSWDCGWYWGFGYVETFDRGKTDIDSHQHFDTLILKSDCFHVNEFFDETPFTDKESWEISDLMQSYYTLKESAELFHLGGSHYTTVKGFTLEDKNECERINKILLPKIFKKLDYILK